MAYCLVTGEEGLVGTRRAAAVCWTSSCALGVMGILQGTEFYVQPWVGQAGCEMMEVIRTTLANSYWLFTWARHYS